MATSPNKNWIQSSQVNIVYLKRWPKERRNYKIDESEWADKWNDAKKKSQQQQSLKLRRRLIENLKWKLFISLVYPWEGHEACLTNF